MKMGSWTGTIALLGIIVLFVGLTMLLIFPEMGISTYYFLLVGGILLCLAFIIKIKVTKESLISKRKVKKVNAVGLLWIFFGIIILINVISLGHYKRFDLTGLAQFTLTQKTQELLKNIENPVEILLFTTPKDPSDIVDYIKNMLGEYVDRSDKLQFKVIDPDEHPDQGRRLGVKVYPTVVFQRGNFHRTVPWFEIIVASELNRGMEAEHAFTSALLETTGKVQKVVYFLVGHGEADLRSNYRGVRDTLRDKLFSVKMLDLSIIPAIPQDAAAVVIAGPKKPLPENESKIIQKYISDDGRIMILLDPKSPKEFKDLLRPWDIIIEDDTIIDPASHAGQSKDNLLVPRLRNLFSLGSVCFPGSTAIIPGNGYKPKPMKTDGGTMPQVLWTKNNSQIQMLSVLRTSQDSILVKDSKLNDNFKTDIKPELKGPFNVGMFLTIALPIGTKVDNGIANKGFRLAIFGDSDFASNSHLCNVENDDLFINSINWITAGKDIIHIERKVVPFRRLVIPPESIRFIRVSSTIILPLIVLLIGGVIWWRRK